MKQLLIPVRQDGGTRLRQPFRGHFRTLVIGSLLRSAEAELAYHRGARHRLRARRAARAVRRLRARADPSTTGPSTPPPRGNLSVGVLSSAALVLSGTFVIVDLIVFGIHSRANVIGDIALVAAGGVWSAVQSLGIRDYEPDTTRAPAASATAEESIRRGRRQAVGASFAGERGARGEARFEGEVTAEGLGERVGLYTLSGAPRAGARSPRRLRAAFGLRPPPSRGESSADRYRATVRIRPAVRE